MERYEVQGWSEASNQWEGELAGPENTFDDLADAIFNAGWLSGDTSWRIIDLAVLWGHHSEQGDGDWHGGDGITLAILPPTCTRSRAVVWESGPL